METRFNLNQVADNVVALLEKSKVNLGRKTKGRDQLIESVKVAIKGAPKADRRNCVKKFVVQPNPLMGPGGITRMTAAESEKSDNA